MYLPTVNETFLKSLRLIEKIEPIRWQGWGTRRVPIRSPRNPSLIILIMSKMNRQTHRRPGWDYSGNGYYFITIVTEDRRNIFGKIVNGLVRLNSFGEIAHNEWVKSADIRDEIFLREFIVMPNHIHGIVGIYHNRGIHNGMERCRDGMVGTNGGPVGSHDGSVGSRGGSVGSHVGLVWANGRSPLRGPYKLSPIPPQKPKSISSFVGGYKSAVTSNINRVLSERGLPVHTRNHRLWQRNYHDRIIRDQSNYFRIAKYIRDNPKVI